MKDPYESLGISSSATDDEVKRAYRELARKYHPDSYQNNPLADLAEEKMKEINEAYEAITKVRKNGGGSSAAYGGNSYQKENSSGQTQIRAMIQAGNLAGAEELLAMATTKDGEWYFLTGQVAYRRGWMDKALQNFRLAAEMSPSNMEYRQALAMFQQGGVGFNPYGNQRQVQTTGCSDCCSTLICLNCLCDGCC